MKHITSYLGLVVVLALAILSCSTFSTSTRDPQVSSPAVPVVTAIALPENPSISLPPALDLLSSQDTLTHLYETVHPGVVSIRVLTQDGEAQGSGFVIDTQGHIVTNYHVVENETDLEVDFPTGTKVRGKVIGTDLDSDLAIIKVDAPPDEIHPLPMGDSDQVKVGQTVIAIGNPFGLEGTMTVGIISGLGRTVQSLHFTSDGGSFTAGDVIQTDAAINPGNSGGPLLNLKGEVIGINESIRTTTFNAGGQPLNSGVGFAISINIVKKVTPRLIASGKYDYPYLGITSPPGGDLSLMEQEALGLPRSTGVYVTSVVNNGPADRAGLKGATQDTDIPNLKSGGDLIIAVDDHPVLTFSDLISYLVKFKSPGDKIVLTVLRGGEQKNLELTLDKRPSP